MLCGVQRLGAALLCQRGREPLKLHFYPHLPNVGSAFFPGKEMIVKQTWWRDQSLRTPPDSVSVQTSGDWEHRQGADISRALHALTRGMSKQAEGLIDTEIDGDISWIVGQPVAKGC